MKAGPRKEGRKFILAARLLPNVGQKSLRSSLNPRFFRIHGRVNVRV
jgi:hypothetical protein